MSAYDNDRPPFTMAGGINRAPRRAPRVSWVLRLILWACVALLAYALFNFGRYAWLHI